MTNFPATVGSSNLPKRTSSSSDSQCEYTAPNESGSKTLPLKNLTAESYPLLSNMTVIPTINTSTRHFLKLWISHLKSFKTATKLKKEIIIDKFFSRVPLKM